MAKIIEFPQIKSELAACAGCGVKLTAGKFWEVDLPAGPGKIKRIGLCNSCYKEAAATGIME